MAVKSKKLKIDFMSLDGLRNKSMKERAGVILGKVEKDRIVVLDAALPADEELNLVEMTLKNVGDKFPGIEVCVLPRKTKNFYNFMNKFLKTVNRQMTIPGLTLIGPSKIIKQIRRNPDSISIFAEV